MEPENIPNIIESAPAEPSNTVSRGQLGYPLDEQSEGSLLYSLKRIIPTLGRNQNLTIPVGATSFTVSSDLMTLTGAGAVTIAKIDNGYDGQKLVLIFTDSNITITDDSTHTTGTVDLASSFTSAANIVLLLVCNGTHWYEVGRSTSASTTDKFGDGADGAGTISSNTTLTRDMFYTTLTIDSANTLSPAGYRVFASTSITVNGTASVVGGNGGNATNGGNNSGMTPGSGGSGGSAGTGVASGTLKEPGNGQAGGAGGNGSSGGSAGDNGSGTTGTAESNCILANNGASGGVGGNGGNHGVQGGGTGGTSTGGTATQKTKASSLFVVQNLVTTSGGVGCNPQSSGGGGGGGGGWNGLGANAGGGGGGGGGSGAPGGILWLCSPTITVSASGTLSVAGGNGGLILLICSSYTNAGAATVSGGTGGTKGAAGTPNSGGGTPGAAADGANGATGSVVQFTVT